MTGMLEDWEARFEKFVRSGLAEGTDPAHDLAHIWRVVAKCAPSGSRGSRPAVVLPAAWLHDCRAAWATRRAGRRPRGWRPSAPGVPAPIGLSAGAHPGHRACHYRPQLQRGHPAGVAGGQSRSGRRPAGRVNIGIARTLLLGGVMGLPLYDDDEPLRKRAPDDKEKRDRSFLRVKLFGLADMMHTAAGRLEGEAAHAPDATVPQRAETRVVGRGLPV